MVNMPSTAGTLVFVTWPPGNLTPRQSTGYVHGP